MNESKGDEMGGLLTASDIAARWQVSVYRVRNFLTKQPGFPAPVMIGKRRRWRTEDVLAYEDGTRERKPGRPRKAA